METPNVTRSRKNAIKKLEGAKADLEFFNGLKSANQISDNPTKLADTARNLVLKICINTTGP